MQNSLAHLGFSPSERELYLHLLSNGKSYANKLSTETKLNRTNVYEALDRLIRKGVVSFVTRNKVKWFEAKAPESLLTLLDNQKDELERSKKNLQKEIKALKPSHSPPLEANIFVGKKGLRMLFEEILQKKKPISIMAAELQFKKLFGPYFELWHKERAEKGIKQCSIFPRSMKEKVKERKLLSYKFVDDAFTNPTTTIIYGDTTLLIQWSKEPLAIKIENKEITKSHLNYFNLLWNS